jgi:hypothetical protein
MRPGSYLLQFAVLFLLIDQETRMFAMNRHNNGVLWQESCRDPATGTAIVPPPAPGLYG